MISHCIPLQEVISISESLTIVNYIGIPFSLTIVKYIVSIMLDKFYCLFHNSFNHYTSYYTTIFVG